MMKVVADGFYLPLEDIVKVVGDETGMKEDDYRWNYINKLAPEIVKLPNFNRYFYKYADNGIDSFMDYYASIISALEGECWLSADQVTEFFSYHKNLVGIIDKITKFDNEEFLPMFGEEAMIIFFRALYRQLDEKTRKEALEKYDEKCVYGFIQEAVLADNSDCLDVIKNIIPIKPCDIHIICISILANTNTNKYLLPFLRDVYTHPERFLINEKSLIENKDKIEEFFNSVFYTRKPATIALYIKTIIQHFSGNIDYYFNRMEFHPDFFYHSESYQGFYLAGYPYKKLKTIENQSPGLKEFLESSDV